MQLCSYLCVQYSTVVNKNLRNTKGDIWVCPNPDYVCTRFFFVYDNSMSVNNSTDTPEFRREIDHAMEYIKAVKAVT